MKYKFFLLLLVSVLFKDTKANIEGVYIKVNEYSNTRLTILPNHKFEYLTHAHFTSIEQSKGEWKQLDKKIELIFSPSRNDNNDTLYYYLVDDESLSEYELTDTTAYSERDLFWKIIEYDQQQNITFQALRQGTVKEGISTYFYPNGRPKLVIEYKNGIKNGVYIEYFSTGRIKTYGKMHNGRKKGKWVYFDL